MDTFLNVAKISAYKAGKILCKYFGRIKRVEHKGDIDLLTIADKKAEEVIVDILTRHFPTHNILSEEGKNQISKTSHYRWIIDPLDGTTNYVHGYPVFCVSIALQMEEKTILGIVYDPLRNELFRSQDSYGSFLNDRRIKVSNTTKLSASLLATGFAYDIKKSKRKDFEYFKIFAMRSQAVRRDGSAALNLCYVACGRFDGFWELKLHPWDTAAGELIVREAGGIVTDFKGNIFHPDYEEIIASNGKIHKEMIKILKI